MKNKIRIGIGFSASAIYIILGVRSLFLVPGEPSSLRFLFSLGLAANIYYIVAFIMYCLFILARKYRIARIVFRIWFFVTATFMMLLSAKWSLGGLGAQIAFYIVVLWIQFLFMSLPLWIGCQGMKAIEDQQTLCATITPEETEKDRQQ